MSVRFRCYMPRPGVRVHMCVCLTPFSPLCCCACADGHDGRGCPHVCIAAVCVCVSAGSRACALWIYIWVLCRRKASWWLSCTLAVYCSFVLLPSFIRSYGVRPQMSYCLCVRVCVYICHCVTTFVYFSTQVHY